MTVPASWNSCRAVLRPVARCILGELPVQTSTRFPHFKPRQKIPVRHVRYIFSAPPLYAAAASVEHKDDLHKDIRDRKLELDRSGIVQYPRETGSRNVVLDEFLNSYSELEAGEKREGQHVTVAGRISSIRRAGGKLAFVDIVEEPRHKKLQVMLNLGSMESSDKKAFSDRIKLIRRGDIISASGVPSRTDAGELSILASSLPVVLAPCLHQIPLTDHQSTTGEDAELLDRHVEMLTYPSTISILVMRSKVIKAMRDFLNAQSFDEVQTPILAAGAGGATARPFETVATEFPDRKLALRIAPELWLKRLILGGMPKVFEIGPSFRNEGLDKTHNPEFTTCEFYAVYHGLPQLQRLTENLFRSIAKAVDTHSASSELTSSDHAQATPSLFDNGDKPYPEIDFIPALNTALGVILPSLSSPSAHSDLIKIFTEKSIPLPSKPTLPRLLDHLSSIYLEPQTQNTNVPVWMINTPECLSPLAKSFIHPTAPNSQSVAARAELFINGREVVNCYEEENSPFEQRRKFVEQQKHAHLSYSSSSTSSPFSTATQTESINAKDDEAHEVDESYIRALEWGLPPTGGWGCGIDRLVMLFTNKDKIGDVLSFGNLRAVTRGAEKWGPTAYDNNQKQ